jgi:signal transduction histidine kinase
LLNNAIKFSPKNSTITVRTTKENSKAIVKISDEGRGIPDGFKDSIFERFKQVEITDAIDKGGSGLGLAICKTIVDLHGGEIAVENNTPKGSTFTFSLPVKSPVTMV